MAVSRSPKASTQPSLGKELQRPGNSEVHTPFPLLRLSFGPAQTLPTCRDLWASRDKVHTTKQGVLLLLHLEADAGKSGPRIPREACRTSPVCPRVCMGQKRSAGQPEMKAEFMARESAVPESLGDSDREGGRLIFGTWGFYGDGGPV